MLTCSSKFSPTTLGNLCRNSTLFLYFAVVLKTTHRRNRTKKQAQLSQRDRATRYVT